MGLFSKIKKAFKKVVKKVAGGIKKVVKGVGKVVKKISKSKLFKAILMAGAIIVTGGAAIGAFTGGVGLAGTGTFAQFGNWMMAKSQLVTGGTLFGSAAGKTGISKALTQTGNFLAQTAAKPFSAVGSALGSAAGTLTDFTGLTTEASRFGVENIAYDPVNQGFVNTKTGEIVTEKALTDTGLSQAYVDTMKTTGSYLDQAGNIVRAGEAVVTPTATKAADTLTGSKWGDFALNTATNLGTSVATGYALNKLTAGDPTGQMAGLAYEGETRLDPLQIYSGGQALSVDGIYQNMMYGTGDPYYQASTELFKQQTIGVPA